MSSMQITETRSEGLAREYRVAVPAAEVDEKVATRLQELAKTLKMPGFRPGRVPLSLVRKKYEPQVRSEALEELLQSSSASVISDRGLRPAGRPKLTITSLSADGTLEYTLALEVLPDITLGDFSSIALERMVAQVSEEAVEQDIGNLRQMYGSLEPVAERRPVMAGDIVTIDCVGRVGDEVVARNSDEGVKLLAGSDSLSFAPGLARAVVGLSVGEEKEIPITYPADFHDPKLAGKDAVFAVTVKEVAARIPAPLDDAFAARLGLETADQLRSNIRQSMERELKDLSRAHLKRALLDRLDSLYAFDLPAGMVDQEFSAIAREVLRERGAGGDGDTGHDRAHDEHDHDHSQCDHEHEHEHEHEHHHDQDQGSGATAMPDPGAALTPEERLEFRKLAERRVKLGLVLAEVGRVNNLKLTQEELNRAVIAEAMRHPGQERAVVEYFRKTPQALDALAGPVLEDKVVDFILELGTITDRPVSPEELRAAVAADE